MDARAGHRHQQHSRPAIIIDGMESPRRNDNNGVWLYGKIVVAARPGLRLGRRVDLDSRIGLVKRSVIKGRVVERSKATVPFEHHIYLLRGRKLVADDLLSNVDKPQLSEKIWRRKEAELGGLVGKEAAVCTVVDDSSVHDDTPCAAS
ncbi:hypothetical protein OCA5_pHCG300100 (plasmid) [Afipia carboxidovorans OM5]|uniref:Uncharacterized protein n=1 Tax=Afipia carboxidovorans (strain ATCC 49405 / DSM 1227 / KCTC 32145 / OM5) TaxID=504832 RepID=Q6LBD2_AFIC5|nr:hypothetical protein OCA4_pHCG3B00100 [Afipia carboxidovorans OM4]AEI08085.1 hypothetical protein OCA5_pHCG300100 [Afipia carboxidovorans OM5]